MEIEATDPELNDASEEEVKFEVDVEGWDITHKSNIVRGFASVLPSYPECVPLDLFSTLPLLPLVFAFGM